MNQSYHNRFSASFMSNTKWRKLFTVIHDKSLPLAICYWKLVKKEKPIYGWLPDVESLGEDQVSYIGDFTGQYLDPVPYYEIEWIEIPDRQGDQAYENAPIKYTYQDLGAILKKIEAIGQFELAVTETAIRIYGYKP